MGHHLITPNPLQGVPCRDCGNTTLYVELRLEFAAKDLGTFSLAGVQTKFSANTVQWPWAVCQSCGAESRGKPDDGSD